MVFLCHCPTGVSCVGSTAEVHRIGNSLKKEVLDGIEVIGCGQISSVRSYL
jgi:hypothetical protein